MTRRTLIAVLTILLGFAEASAEPPVLSLRTTHNLPAGEMEAYFSPDAWKLIYEAPITGFVVMRGTVNRDQSVTITTSVESFPDRARDVLAKQFADRVRIVAPSVGSHLSPAADVFVLFYESTEQSQQAVVFARPHASTMSRSTFAPRTRTVVKKDTYLEVVEYRKKPATTGAPPTGASGTTAGGAGHP